MFMGGGQGITCRSWSVFLVGPGDWTQVPGLEASTFAYWAISPAYGLQVLKVARFYVSNLCKKLKQLALVL